MQSLVGRLSLFAVAMLIGVLLVAQLRAQARPVEISSLSSQELSTLIQQLSTRNKELRDGLAALREQLRDYRVAEERGQSTLDVTREELRRIMAFGGLTAVEGQGIVLDVDGTLTPVAINDLVNELRNAGAEALAVDEVRITARSVAVQGTRSIEIDGTPIGRTFSLSAIGDPEGLLAALRRPGGIIAQLEQSVAATIDVEPLERIRIPATERDLAPRDALLPEGAASP